MKRGQKKLLEPTHVAEIHWFETRAVKIHPNPPLPDPKCPRVSDPPGLLLVQLIQLASLRPVSLVHRLCSDNNHSPRPCLCTSSCRRPHPNRCADYKAGVESSEMGRSSADILARSSRSSDAIDAVAPEGARNWGRGPTHMCPEAVFFVTKKSKKTALGDLSRMSC